MSRAGYSEDIDGWQLIKWRGAVASAIRGRRGQAFLREMRAALDALPGKRLIDRDLVRGGEVCAIGAVGLGRREVNLPGLDPEDHDMLATAFGISGALAREVMYENDEGTCLNETPEARWARMRAWVESQIREDAP